MSKISTYKVNSPSTLMCVNGRSESGLAFRFSDALLSRRAGDQSVVANCSLARFPSLNPTGLIEPMRRKQTYIERGPPRSG
jgi:hypothetical protein